VSLILFGKVLPYWIAQYLGAFVAAAVVYGVYVGMYKKK
jgi:glycerol uptake facilitator-like aquaporin